MRMSIAGITIDIEGMGGQPLGEAAEKRYAAFLSHDPADIQVRARVRPVGAGALVDADQPVVRVEKIDAERYRIVRLDNPFEAVLDFDSGTVEAAVVNNIYCLDSLVRILYSLLLVRSGGLLLHSAAVAFGDRAGVFAGLSEAGKTTLGSLGFPKLLSDELVAIRRNGDGFKAYGTPFWGEFVPGPVREEADIAGLYLLRKGPRDEVRSMPLASALLEVMGCVFFFGPPEHAGDVLRLVGELVESRFEGEFYFVPEPGVVTFLEKELSEMRSDFPNRNSDTAWRMVDGEMIVVSAASSNITALNATGALIWELGDGTKSVDDIAAAVSEAFEVDHETALDDVQSFIDSLAAEGLMSLATAASTS